MQATDQPPVYNEYPTELPAGFPIGGKNTTPLVNVTELQAHLRLLGAFSKLKYDVQQQEEGVAATSKDTAWVVFVNRAVERFFKWASASWDHHVPGFDERLVPPLDVVMVWHTYLLNPRTFLEDSRRMSTTYCSNLTKIHDMPLTLISSLIDGQSLDPLPPSTERQDIFERVTGLSWPLPLITEGSDCLSVPCPFCRTVNHLVRWIADGGLGYAQASFKHRCESCNKQFTKPNMGMRRFVDEVSMRRSGQRVFFPETLLDPPSGTVNEKGADQFVEKAFKMLDIQWNVLHPLFGKDPVAEADALGTALNFDYEVLSDQMHLGVRPMHRVDRAHRMPRIQRLSVAYSFPGLASIDLVGAVLRQASFIVKMDELGWTRPGRFDLASDSAPLVRSIARYHAFLDLMSVQVGIICVPTLDIDLAWHTHQLKGNAYRGDTLQYVKRYPNHDDNIDPMALSTAYDITAKAWKARYGVPYSVCGCVPDPDSESRISRFASKISSGLKKRDESPASKTLVNNRPDLVSTEDDEADCSHPSEHNINYGDPTHSDAKLKKEHREVKTAKCVASAKKGASRDPWRGLQAERNEKRKKDGHKEAFADPYYGYDSTEVTAMAWQARAERVGQEAGALAVVQVVQGVEEVVVVVAVAADAAGTNGRGIWAMETEYLRPHKLMTVSEEERPQRWVRS
ncbi:hypothetical protein PIIN_06179 [Serendipita indica DSM 11827]|uniref:Uncharacterized protein n=1 Tax=Serendipita indica (strain DSM 11827) TaxID=1109443 RepID=G4TLP9_SERID|nr:hypothetical protein PIIN_06179 [Serendipita indica DSM 11827]